MLRRLLRTFLTPYRRELALVVTLQLVGTVAALSLPNLNARIVDDGVATGDTSVIVRLGLMMLAAAAIQIVCSIGSVHYGAAAAMGLGRDIRARVLHSVGTFSRNEIHRFGASSLITRNTNDVQQIQILVMSACSTAVVAPIVCVGGVIMALREDASLSSVLLISVPVLAGAVSLIIIKMIPGFGAMQQRIDSINRILREQITGIRVVRAFSQERREMSRFCGANSDLKSTTLHVGKYMALLLPAVTLISNATGVAVVWFGALAVDRGSMDIGVLTAQIMYVSLILGSITTASLIVMMIPRSAVCAGRIQDVLTTVPSVQSPHVPTALVDEPDSIDLHDVGYTHRGADHPVVSGVSMTCARGTTTAVIGGTGAGKSTLLDLIRRSIDTTWGQVRIGGIDIRELDLDVVRSQVGIVPQRSFLLAGTIGDNLRIGRRDATDAELWKALEAAQAADFVASMRGGLDSVVSQGGTSLSGGQRQRIAIARVLVRRPAVYLLDDPYSALDASTERAVRSAVAEQTADSITVIVAQKVADVMNADRILVLDNGIVAGSGTHDQLIDNCAIYAEIAQSQLSGVLT